MEAMSYTDNVAKFVDLLGPLFDTPPPPALQARLNGNGESGEDDIETIQAPNREQPLYTKADRRPEEKLERKPVGGINGHQSNFDSEEDEFSDTYDHIGDEEEEEGGNSPLPHSEPSLLVNAVNEALRSGTDRMLVQDSESQLWAFYADKQGQATDNGANVRGGGDDTQHSKGALPRGLPQGRGYNSRGYRSRREGDGGSEGLPQDRASRGANLHGAAGGSGGQGYGGGGRHRLPLEVSEQLAVAVLRLQQTMDEVVARLEALETLLQHSKSSQVQRWSLFGGVAPHVLLLLLAWPVVFQLGFYILSQRRNRQLR